MARCLSPGASPARCPTCAGCQHSITSCQVRVGGAEERESGAAERWGGGEAGRVEAGQNGGGQGREAWQSGTERRGGGGGAGRRGALWAVCLRNRNAQLGKTWHAAVLMRVRAQGEGAYRYPNACPHVCMPPPTVYGTARPPACCRRRLTALLVGRPLAAGASQPAQPVFVQQQLQVRTCLACVTACVPCVRDACVPCVLTCARMCTRASVCTLPHACACGPVPFHMPARVTQLALSWRKLPTPQPLPFPALPPAQPTPSESSSCPCSTGLPRCPSALQRLFACGLGPAERLPAAPQPGASSAWSLSCAGVWAAAFALPCFYPEEVLTRSWCTRRHQETLIISHLISVCRSSTHRTCP